MSVFTHLAEKRRKTVYDFVQENLDAANRVTCVHRSISIGGHLFGLSDSGIEECFTDVVTEVNQNCPDERISGLLLCYPSFFCLIIDGSEHMMITFWKTLLDKHESQIGIFKILAFFHHVPARVLDNWLTIVGSPPRLYGKLPREADRENTFRFVSYCIKKLFDLCIRLKKTIKITESVVHYDLRPSKSINTSLEEFSKMHLNSLDESRYSAPSKTFSQMINKVSVLSASSSDNRRTDMFQWKDCLPEYGVIMFLLNSSFLLDVQDYIKKVACLQPLPEHNSWPINQYLHLPENVFDKPIDPCTNLPKIIPKINKEIK